VSKYTFANKTEFYMWSYMSACCTCICTYGLNAFNDVGYITSSIFFFEKDNILL